MKGKIISTITLLFLVAALLPESTLLKARAQLLDPTSMALEPDGFNVESENSLTFIAILTSNGSPVSDRTITFTTTWGTFSPVTGTVTTDSEGKATITYNPPVIAVDDQPVSVTATFAGDLSYQSSSATSSGTINLLASTTLTISPSSFTVIEENSIALTATLTSNGSPVSGKDISFSVPSLTGTVSPITGTTDSEGEVTTTFTAPSTAVDETSVTVSASFLGDWDYESSSDTASGTIQGSVLTSTTLSLSPSTFTVASENSTTLTATLTSNGSPLKNKTITFSTLNGAVSPTNGATDSNGEATVTYTAPSATTSTSATVTATFAGDLNYQTSAATASGTIQAGPLIMPISEDGVAFKIPKTLEDEISSYKQGAETLSDLLPIQIPTTGFLLANEDRLSLVLSTESGKGVATVEGWYLSNTITLGGVSLNVILAENVAFDKTGEPASVGDIASNPEDYKLDLVKVSATRRHVSILFELENKAGVKLPLTTGYLVEDPKSAAELVRKSIRTGRNLLENLSKSYVKSLLQTDESRLGVFDFETDYWIDSPAETNGIVLTSGPILNKLKEIVPKAADYMQLETGIPVLYDVKTELNYQNVPSVGEINQNPSDYRNQIVGLTVNEFGAGISVQEVIKTATGAAIPADVRLEGSVNWNDLSIPPEVDETLPATGASSKSQDDLVSSIKGRFTLVGRVVTAKQIDDSLAEKPILLVYGKIGADGIDWEGLANEAKALIKSELGKLNWSLSSFTNEEIAGLSTNPPEEVNVVESPGEIENLFIENKGEVFVKSVNREMPVELDIVNSEVSKIKVNFATDSENVNISLEKVDKEEPGVPEPPGKVYSYNEICIRAPEDAVKEAEITFKVPKEWLETQDANKEDVRLLKYHEGNWENLPTTFESETPTHFRYSAETSEFSIFAITAIRTEAAEEGGGVPILAVIGGVIVVLLTVTIAAFRRRRKIK